MEKYVTTYINGRRVVVIFIPITPGKEVIR